MTTKAGTIKPTATHPNYRTSSNPTVRFNYNDSGQLVLEQALEVQGMKDGEPFGGIDWVVITLPDGSLPNLGYKDEPLTCDYCKAEVNNPWHGSGLLNGEENPHIHACDACRHKLPQGNGDNG